MLIARFAVALLVSLVLGACGSGNPGGTASPFQTPLVVGTTVPSRLEVTVGGAETFTFTDVVPLRIVIAGQNPGVPEELRLLNFGLLTPVTLEDGRLMRPALDILGYTGAGTYRYGPGIPRASSGAPIPAVFSSDVLIELTRLGSPLVTFNQLRGTCTVRVDDQGARSGSLSCDAVADETGRVISIGMEWDPA